MTNSHIQVDYLINGLGGRLREMIARLINNTKER